MGRRLPQEDTTDACAKVRRPADGERVDVEWSLLKPSGVVGDEREVAETDLAALHQSSARNHDQGDRKKSQLLKLGAKTPGPKVGANCRGSNSDSDVGGKYGEARS